ncbi:MULTISPECIES: rcc01693 family protein [unclassified Rhizobium]|uniref:rcc01693 family protein n=1 Tax=unclassified Rhizobium TaxID=2613769 RepID=UPI003D2851D5
MHVGLCLLRLTPTDFWALTPRELTAMSGAWRPVAPVLQRVGLQTLMHQFPD